jgi:hypothetical protein
MSEFAAVETLADYRQLDDGEILEGYFDGFHGSAAPGSGRSRGYWHGWRNGRVDAGLAKPDAAQHALEEAFRALQVQPAPGSWN